MLKLLCVLVLVNVYALGDVHSISAACGEGLLVCRLHLYIHDMSIVVLEVSHLMHYFSSCVRWNHLAGLLQ